MSLIDECKKLRGLEQKYKITPYDGNLEVYSLHLREHGSAMLDILGMIREGDAEDLSCVAEFFKADCELEGDRIAAVIRRYEKMAALMEKEEQ